MKTKMAENNKGGILNITEKFLRRRKTKVLQSLGKTEKTTDEKLVEDCHKLDRQQEVATKLQKELRNYVNHAKALSVASKAFYGAVSEAYEPEWENHAQLTNILTSVDVLWQDYLQKLQDSVQEPLTKYLANIPQIRARVSKRGRKLTDYDNAKHNLTVQQNAKKKDEAKINKAQEDLVQAQKIYDDMNNELHQELPEFFNSRMKFYGELFKNLFSAEHVFQTETGKIWNETSEWQLENLQGSEQFVVNATHLADQHEHARYTPRKSVRSTSTIIVGSDENLTNGHSDSSPESPLPDSASPSQSPTSQGPDRPLTNGTAEADTSKESVEEIDYENEEFISQKPEDDAVEDQVAASKAEGVHAERPETVGNRNSTASNGSNTAVKGLAAGAIEADNSEIEPMIERAWKVKEEEEPKRALPHQLKKAAEDAHEVVEEKKVLDDDEFYDQDAVETIDEWVPSEAPPPIPSTPPPEEAPQDMFYEVPPPAKPVDNDLPEKYIYTVMSTHAYKGEDDDELSFDAHEVIYVIYYEDPDEQDPGWLMGVRKLDGQKGVFPENFTRKV